MVEYFKNDKLSRYYNNGLKDIVLTSDIDWAPEYAIEDLLNIIKSFDFRITTFATHKSEVLLQKHDFVEVGIHPDFTRKNQNEWFDAKIKNLKDLYPDAVGTRSHRNFFGQNIGDIALVNGLEYDVSTFLWNEPFCQAHVDYNGMLRFSYMWEDGIHLDTDTPKKIENINLHSPGLKILNVHPILIYLNAPNDDYRRMVTSQYKDLTQAPKEEIDKHINRTEYGIKDFYIDILKYLKKENVNSYMLRELI